MTAPFAAGANRELFEGETDSAYVLAARAVWGFALVEATRLRQVYTRPQDPFSPRPSTSPAAPLNNIGHQLRLADATLKGGVAPNVDTLYSTAWLDLSDEPFVLETPDFGSRHYTFQLAYGDGACDFSLGQRTHGRQLPTVFIAGPDEQHSPPAGMLVVRSHTRYFLVVGRILVQPDDPADYEAVSRLQDRIALRPLSRYLAGLGSPNDVPAEHPLEQGTDLVVRELRFLRRLANVLRDWLVAPQEDDLIDSFARLGLSPGAHFEPGSLNPAARSEVARGLAEGAVLVEQRPHDLGRTLRTLNGWTINDRGPRFGDDYLLRSAVAKDQIYVTVPEEALYLLSAVDRSGRGLTGEHAYRLSFAADAWPPADAFWSLTLYGEDGPLVANRIDRYAIGDRTSGLLVDRDGSLTVQIQHASPASGSRFNWLPAPAGVFRLMLRLFVPRASALDGSWTPPAIERVARV